MKSFFAELLKRTLFYCGMSPIIAGEYGGGFNNVWFTMLRALKGCWMYFVFVFALFPIMKFGGQFRDLLLRDSVEGDVIFGALCLTCFFSFLFYLTDLAASREFINPGNSPNLNNCKLLALKMARLAMFITCSLLLLCLIAQLNADPISRKFQVTVWWIFGAHAFLQPIGFFVAFRIRQATIEGGKFSLHPFLYYLSSIVVVIMYCSLSAGFLYQPSWFTRVVAGNLVATFFVAMTQILFFIRGTQLLWRYRIKLLPNYSPSALFLVAIALLIIQPLAVSLSQGEDNRGIAELKPKHLRDEMDKLNLKRGFENWASWRKARMVEKWGRKLDNDPQEIDVIIFVADGGGIHAAVRSATILSQLQAMNPEFADSVFATSTVSGGSLGTLSFFAVNSGCEAAQPNAAFKLDIRQKVGMTVGSDFLTPVLGKTLFCEPLGLIFRRFSEADRGKGLEVSLRAGLLNSGTDVGETALAYAEAPLIEWRDPSSEAIKDAKILAAIPPTPIFIFNTTNPSGELFQLSALKSQRFKSLANLKSPQNLSRLSASCASARFPLVTGPASIRISDVASPAPGAPAKASEYLVDGGLYDNSGLSTALELVEELARIQAAERKNPTSKWMWKAKIRVMLVVSGNGSYESPYNDDPSDASQIVLGRKEDLADIGPPIASGTDHMGDLKLWFGSAVGNILYRNKESGASLYYKSKDKDAPFSVMTFPWCGDVVSAPLGWVMFGERRRAVTWLFGSDVFYDRRGRSFPQDPERIYEDLSFDKDCTECQWHLEFHTDAGMENHLSDSSDFQMQFIRQKNKMSSESIQAFTSKGWFTKSSLWRLLAIEQEAKDRKPVTVGERWPTLTK